MKKFVSAGVGIRQSDRTLSLCGRTVSDAEAALAGSALLAKWRHCAAEFTAVFLQNCRNIRPKYISWLVTS